MREVERLVLILVVALAAIRIRRSGGTAKYYPPPGVPLILRRLGLLCWPTLSSAGLLRTSERCWSVPKRLLALPPITTCAF